MPPMTYDQLNAQQPAMGTAPPPAPMQQKRIVWDEEPPQAQPAVTQKRIVWDDTPPEPAPTVTDRIFGSRLPGMQKTAERYVAGQISAPEMLLSHAASGGARIADAVIGAAGMLVPQPVKDLGASALQTVGSIPNPFPGGKTIGEDLPAGLDIMAQNNPRLATNTRTVLDAAAILPAAKTIDVAAKLGAKGASTAASNFRNSGPFPDGFWGTYKGDTTSQLLPSYPKPPGAAEFAQMSGDAAKLAKEVGGSFGAAQVANKVADKIDELLPAPVTGAKLTSEQRGFMRDLREYDGIRGKNWTIDDVEKMDKTLTAKINKYVQPNGTVTDEGRQLMQLQTTMRKALDEIPENAANNALLNMRSNWQAKKILDDLEDIAKQSQLRDNPAQYMQGRVRTILADGDRIRGWPKEVITALEKTAKTGTMDGFLSFMSGRLPTIIAGATGNLGTAAGAAVAQGMAVGGRTGLVSGRLAKAEQAVVKSAMAKQRPVVVPPPTKPLSEVMNLPDRLLLPAPSNKTGLAGSTYTPLSPTQLSLGERLLNKPAKIAETSGPTTIAPPVNQLTNLSGKLGRGKKVELDNLSRMLLDGDLSTNKFVESVRQEFGLNVKQARTLAKDVKASGPAGLDVLKPKKSLQEKIADFVNDESGSLDLDRVKEVRVRAFRGGISSKGKDGVTYFTTDKKIAVAYQTGSADEKTLRGGKIFEKDVVIKKPAREKDVLAVVKKHFPDDTEAIDALETGFGAMVLDSTLYDNAGKIVNKLKTLGYDGAILNDSLSDKTTYNAYIMFDRSDK